MAVVGIIGCTMLLVCAFGMLDTMNSYLDWEFNKISNFEYKLSLSNNYTNEQLEKLTDKYVGIIDAQVVEKEKEVMTV